MAKPLFVRTAIPKFGVILVLGAALAAITWLIFGQTVAHQFVTYDDPQYIYENAKVAAGFSLESVFWAFTHTVGGNWHPLTIISHMFALRSEASRTSFYQRSVAHDCCHPPVFCAATNDRHFVAKRFCRGAVRNSSAACGIGRMDF